MGHYLNRELLCEGAYSFHLLMSDLVLIFELAERWHLLYVYIVFFRWLALRVIVLRKRKQILGLFRSDLPICFVLFSDLHRCVKQLYCSISRWLILIACQVGEAATSLRLFDLMLIFIHSILQSNFLSNNDAVLFVKYPTMLLM